MERGRLDLGEQVAGSPLQVGGIVLGRHDAGKSGPDTQEKARAGRAQRTIHGEPRVTRAQRAVGPDFAAGRPRRPGHRTGQCIGRRERRRGGLHLHLLERVRVPGAEGPRRVIGAEYGYAVQQVRRVVRRSAVQVNSLGRLRRRRYTSSTERQETVGLRQQRVVAQRRGRDRAIQHVLWLGVLQAADCHDERTTIVGSRSGTG